MAHLDDLSWFYRLKMVISQFATVNIQRLNHPKIIPMAQGEHGFQGAMTGATLWRLNRFLALRRFPPPSHGDRKTAWAAIRLDPGSQNKPNSPEKNWKKQRKLGGFWIVFWGEVTSLIFLDSSQLSGFWQKKQGGFGIDDAFHHLPSPSRFL